MNENLNNTQDVTQTPEVQPVQPAVQETPMNDTPTIVETTPVPEQTPAVDAKKEKKVNWILIVGLIVISVLVAIVFGFIALFSLLTNNSSKLVCKSNEGNITIFYDKTQITGYTAVGITYDLDGQKQIAQKIGTEEYVLQFEDWFKTHTTGSCTYEKN